MYQLFGFKRSRSDRPLWLLEELQQPYEFFQLDFAKGDNRSEYFLGLNPAGKVPALRHGDLTLIESGAICTYLADRHPDAGSRFGPRASIASPCRRSTVFPRSRPRHTMNLAGPPRC